MTRAHRIRSLVPALAITSLVAACASGHAAGTGSAPPEPASVAPVGHSGLHRITLTSDAAKRVGLRTATVQAAAGATERVATAAVLYEDDGSTWVYRRVAPLTFERAPVALIRTVGSLTVLRSGPPVGSVVATVGIAELRGAEDGVPGEQ